MKSNKELRETVGRMELKRRMLEERVERLETWVSQTEQEQCCAGAETFIIVNYWIIIPTYIYLLHIITLI